MADEIREKTIEDYFKRRVKEEGGIVRKLKWIAHNSAMDRLVVLNLKVALVEIKRPGKKPTAAQTREMLRFGKAGVIVAWVSTKAQVENFIDFMQGRVACLNQHL